MVTALFTLAQNRHPSGQHPWTLWGRRQGRGKAVYHKHSVSGFFTTHFPLPSNMWTNKRGSQKDRKNHVQEKSSCHHSPLLWLWVLRSTGSFFKCKIYWDFSGNKAWPRSAAFLTSDGYAAVFTSHTRALEGELSECNEWQFRITSQDSHRHFILLFTHSSFNKCELEIYISVPVFNYRKSELSAQLVICWVC